jgi:hypothetical protein
MGRAVMQNESAIGLISATPEQPHLSYTQRPPPPLCFIYSFSPNLTVPNAVSKQRKAHCQHSIHHNKQTGLTEQTHAHFSTCATTLGCRNIILLNDLK